jgi:hypothetical protein
MKRIFTFLLVSGIFTGTLHSQDFVIDEPSYHNSSSSSQVSSSAAIPYIGSVPTPDNFTRGALYSEFLMYDGGGVGLRLNVGIFDILSIGVAENFDHVIGTQPIHLNIPSAYIKFSFYEPRQKFNYAFGFDSFAYGSNGSYLGPDGLPGTMYGFYFTTGRSYTVFRSRNIFSMGVRVPVLPNDFRNFTNSSLFMGATLGGKYIKTAFTLENIYINFSRPSSILPSLLVRFYPVNGFEMGLTLQYQLYNDIVNRIFNLSYTTSL